MRATQIRDLNGQKTQLSLEILCEAIVAKAAVSGFITEASVISATSIKIGMHMASFRINTAQLGYNARVNRFTRETPKGYKRTNVPTWEQREDFNHLVNSVFDLYKLQARIVSGNYLVRDKKDGAISEWNYGGDISDTSLWGMQRFEQCTEIVPEKDAREDLDSDKREKEYKEAQRPIIALKNKERRLKQKAIREAKKLSVSWYDWKTNERVTVVYTQKGYASLLAKLSPYERKKLQVEPFLSANVIQLKRRA